MKYRDHLPPQDMIISPIHFYSFLETKMEVVTVAQQPDTLAWDSESGTEALCLGGSNSNSAEPVGAEVPRVTFGVLWQYLQGPPMQLLSVVWAAVCHASPGAALFSESSFPAFPMML